MRAAAIGVHVHSGWGALVAIAGPHGEEEIVARRRVVIIDPKTAGAKQPYHYVEAMEIGAAEKHLARCEQECHRLAFESLNQISAEMQERGFSLACSAILLSSARPLPALDRILASHALIHTAEGEFFRQIFRRAFEQLGIAVTGIRERELDEHASRTFGKKMTAVRMRIDGMGRALGPPWTQDEKLAALSAAIVLAESNRKPGIRSKVHTL